MSIPDIIPQLKDPKIKEHADKPTVLINHPSLPAKQFCIFEDELPVIVQMFYNLRGSKEKNSALFAAGSFSKSELPSPWKVQEISFSDLLKLEKTASFKPELSAS